MASITAVELGADMCALARVVVRRGEVQLFAAEALDPAAFPGLEAFTSAVRHTRKSLKLSRRCRAVVWGLPDGAGRRDPTIKPLLAPLRGAGFRIERAISPCNALAALARLRMPRGDGATCWLAINRTGVAMVVVRPGRQIYSHSFAWDSTVGSSGSQARLLQRYSLVAFLTPEIRRAMAVAREKGTSIDSIVTCGNLPEIRSLTMPLIEELDVEVESLDSLEGLIVKPDALDKLSDAAAALRIACAGAIARPTRRVDESKRSSPGLRSLLRVGASAAVILGVLAIGWQWWNSQPTPSSRKSSSTVKPTPAPKQTTTAQKSAPHSTPPPAQKTTTKSAPPQTVAKPAPPPVSIQKPAPLIPGKAAPTPPPRAVQKTPAPVGTASNPPQSNPPVVTAAPKVQQSKPPLVSAPPKAQPANQPKRLDVPVRPADKPDAGRVRPTPTGTEARKTPESKPMPELLKDPVPRVTAILISSDRRMATIDDGRVIGIGDLVGQREVVGIDDRAVVLREPSGVKIRVALGGRIIGVERSER